MSAASFEYKPIEKAPPKDKVELKLESIASEKEEMMLVYQEIKSNKLTDELLRKFIGLTSKAENPGEVTSICHAVIIRELGQEKHLD